MPGSTMGIIVETPKTDVAKRGHQEPKAPTEPVEGVDTGSGSKSKTAGQKIPGLCNLGDAPSRHQTYADLQKQESAQKLWL